MKWKTAVIVGAGLFLAGLILGFVPEYQTASKLAKQLETARLEGKLGEIRELASLSYVEASQLNYGSAADNSERMFSIASKAANDTKDAGLRTSLNGLSTFRDKVNGKLRAVDPSVLEPLHQIVQKTQKELRH